MKIPRPGSKPRRSTTPRPERKRQATVDEVRAMLAMAHPKRS